MLCHIQPLYGILLPFTYQVSVTSFNGEMDPSYSTNLPNLLSVLHMLFSDAIATLFSLDVLGLSYRECTQSEKLLKSLMAKVDTRG